MNRLEKAQQQLAELEQRERWLARQQPMFAETAADKISEEVKTRRKKQAAARRIARLQSGESA